ncbi:helicase [Heliothis virescens ascovirus 3f]|uniref:Helicase n=1 Tax=Heliothis virescens ascovirus 3f TaxID=328614 RepID=A0A171PVL1_9VIRU|nr:helicase [Heliothis virescens ascovirus 3f]AJP09093.1 helicase [Heliothis virescens ascovirus 3f]
MSVDNSTWTDSQKSAYEGIITTFKRNVVDVQRCPIFVSGGGGTGKSFLLHQLRKYFESHGVRVAVTATQAVAAQLVSGKTLHSTFKIRRIRSGDSGSFVCDIDMFPYEVLIVDEVSMLSDTLLDTIEQKLTTLRDCRAPFGGVFVVGFGDLLQLSPVQDREVYMAQSWKYFKLVALTTSVRHGNDKQYDNLMSRLRIGDKTVVNAINEKCVKTSSEVDKELLDNNTTVVVAKNIFAERNNLTIAKRLVSVNDLKNAYRTVRRHESSMDCASDSDKDYYTRYEVERIVPKELSVFPGATLMFTANGLSGGPWCNGDICKVVSIQCDTFNGTGDVISITVKMVKDNTVIVVQPQSYRYTVASDFASRSTRQCIVGYPLTYGWSVTIHKVQGSTYDRLVVNPSEIFCAGQLYVALSRVRSCDGLLLTEPIKEEQVMCSKRTLGVYAAMKRLVTDGTVCGTPSCMGDVYKRLYEECMRRMYNMQEQLTNINLELVTVCAENAAALGGEINHV